VGLELLIQDVADSFVDERRQFFSTFGLLPDQQLFQLLGLFPLK